jgi:hypothetical protein
MMKNRPVSKFFFLVLCLLALAVGCAGTRKTAEPVFKGELQGSPEAEAKLDPSRITVSPVKGEEGPFQHPFTVQGAKMEGLLQAIHFQKSATLRWENPERLLSDLEAAGLAQKVAPAFSSLGTNELIRFCVKGKDGETRGELFVAKDLLNFRILTVQGYEFLKKGSKATSHQWKLTPQEGQGFFPSNAVVWNPKETTNWIVVKISDLASVASEGQEETPEKQPLKKRLDVFP